MMEGQERGGLAPRIAELTIGAIAGALGAQLWWSWIMLFGVLLGSQFAPFGSAGLFAYRLLVFAPHIVALLVVRRFDRSMAVVVAVSAVAATIFAIRSSELALYAWQRPGESPP
jgi:hypothetical protein